jgi:hypothetical protein
VARQFADQVEIIGVAARDEPAAFDGFVERHDLAHVTHIADLDGSVWGRFGISGQPAWVLIDGETGQREVIFGALGRDRLTRLIEDLIASVPGRADGLAA